MKNKKIAYIVGIVLVGTVVLAIALALFGSGEQFKAMLSFKTSDKTPAPVLTQPKVRIPRPTPTPLSPGTQAPLSTKAKTPSPALTTARIKSPTPTPQPPTPQPPATPSPPAIDPHLAQYGPPSANYNEGTIEFMDYDGAIVDTYSGGVKDVFLYNFTVYNNGNYGKLIKRISFIALLDCDTQGPFENYKPDLSYEDTVIQQYCPGEAGYSDVSKIVSNLNLYWAAIKLNNQAVNISLVDLPDNALGDGTMVIFDDIDIYIEPNNVKTIGLKGDINLGAGFGIVADRIKFAIGDPDTPIVLDTQQKPLPKTAVIYNYANNAGGDPQASNTTDAGIIITIQPAHSG